MKTITLNILAEDIRTTDYFNQEDCAISRSLKRAGINADERGLSIRHNILKELIPLEKYKEFSLKVRDMYASIPEKDMCIIREQALEPQDFSFDLEVPDDW